MQRLSTVLLGTFGLVFSILAAASPTSPKAFFGFEIGADYQLATFTQTEGYFKKLGSESDRVKYVDIGPTEEGRRQCMLVITSPANQAKLEHYRSISRRLAHADDLSDKQARSLAEQGKAVVWIDGGLHSEETAGFMQLIETAWRFASRNDPQTLRILDNTIILLVHANPDGHELVSSWYMRQSDPKKRSKSDYPRLYQKYIGHDNNRDFFMLNMRESVNLSRQMYIEWLPQIMFNHHQTAPDGTVIAIPPYRGPFNYVYDPLIVSGLDALGSAIYNRFNSEGKPGAVRQDGTVFSTWWNGGLRTTAYYHNIIGILTEIIGDPTPITVPLTPDRLFPTMALPNPIAPQLWHFRQTIDYSLSANYAVLDYAARHRDELLYNIYRMGRNAIDRGSEEHWTLYPSRVQALRAAYDKERKEKERKKAEAAAGSEAKTDAKAEGKAEEKSAETLAREDGQFFDRQFRKPEWRDARAFIVPADQPDFPTAVKFINTLINSGIQVQRATAGFTVNGKSYPAGSYVVKTAQAFRAHVIDLFEPQDHPNDFKYEGGPPIPPYDSSGWTLAFEMGVQFDRVVEAVDGPFAVIPYGQVQTPPPGKLARAGGNRVAGWVLSPRQNDAFRLVNALLEAGVEVYRLPGGIPEQTAFGPGAFYISAAGRGAVKESTDMVERGVAQLGLTATTLSDAPAGQKLRLTPARIALLDVYGGSMTSGWTRWLFEQFGWPFEVIYPKQIDAGNLNAKYDILVLAESNPFQKPDERYAPKITERELPEEYRIRFGRMTEEKSLPQLKQFLAGGGRIVAIGADAALTGSFALPARNALTEIGPDSRDRPLPKEKFFIPGSILQAQLDLSRPVTWGLPENVDFYSGQDSAFALLPQAAAKGLKPIAWYASAQPLRSGWGWGQHYLANTIAAFEVPVGAGTFYLYAPNVNFRGQTHGVFKLLFNPLYLTADSPSRAVASSQ